MKRSIRHRAQTFVALALWVLAASAGQAQPNDEAFEAQQRGDSRTAGSLWRARAEQGEPAAQYELGRAYESGVGVTQDDAEAVRWYAKAADEAYVPAFTALARMYISGRGVAQDFDIAVKWLREAQLVDDPGALYQLGLLHRTGHGVAKSDREATRLIVMAAYRGHAAAQYEAGDALYAGAGIKKDVPGALFMFAQAALQGDLKAASRVHEIVREFDAYRVSRPSIRLREFARTDARILGSLLQGTKVYRLEDPKNGWYGVYVPEGHRFGFVSAPLVEPVDRQPIAPNSIAPQSAVFPDRPEPREGFVTCNTRCINATCYRTYSDGRQVTLQATPVWDPLSNTFMFDAGAC